MDGLLGELSWCRKLCCRLIQTLIHYRSLRSRQECRPIPQRLAKSIGANLYCGRLPGHGRRHPRGILGGLSPYGETLVSEAHPREMFLEAVHALRMGLSLGEQVILVGMSTGAALLTWLASLDFVQENEHVASMVLISPAYALGHPLYPLLKHTFASMRLAVPQFVRAIVLETLLGGKTKRVAALSAEHERYTTLCYPNRAVLNLLDVLFEVEGVDLSKIQTPILMVGNPGDPVVNFRVTGTNNFLKMGDSSRKSLYCCSTTEHMHCIASEMLSPSGVDEVSRTIIQFVQQSLDEGVSIIPPTLIQARQTSVSSGLGTYGRSFPSFGELGRPVEF